jgi:hypothetical protein
MPTITHFPPKPPVQWPPAEKLVHDSRERVMSASASGKTATDFNTSMDLYREGWHRLSAPTTRRIREQYPDADLVCAIYDLTDLHRPAEPLATNEGYWLDAAQHSKDRGNAVAVSVAADGTVEGLHASEGVTVERLVDAARCASHDSWRIVAAIVEMLSLRELRFRFTPEETALLREGCGRDEAVYLLYDWRNLSRPIKVYSERHFEWAHRRAIGYHHLLAGLKPSGRVFGIETGPGPGLYFEDVLHEHETRTSGTTDANAMAVLGAVMVACHLDWSCEVTKDCYGDDVTPGDVPEGKVLIEVKRKYVAASLAAVETQGTPSTAVGNAAVRGTVGAAA